MKLAMVTRVLDVAYDDREPRVRNIEHCETFICDHVGQITNDTNTTHSIYHLLRVPDGAYKGKASWLADVDCRM